MNKPRALSKSKLMAYRQCPKRLWLEVHQPESKQDSDDTERRFRAGHEVGEVAQRVYDPEGRGVLIDPWGDGFDKAIKQSMELMGQSRPVFEATLSTGQALAMADVMLPVTENGLPTAEGESDAKSVGWKMIEVKSATSVKDYYHDDVAVQLHIANSVGINIRQLVLAHIDNNWIYPGGGRYQGLFKEVDVTAEAGRRDADVRQWIDEGQQIIARSSAPEIETGDHCTSPYRCGFHDFCHDDDDDGAEFSVHWFRYPNNALKELISEGVEDMRDVLDQLLSPQNKLIKRCTVEGIVHADYEGALKDLEQCRFPLYFLDFETAQFAVPIWAGTRPYQQLVFQYSLHTLDEKGDMRHKEFLDLSGNDPSRAIAESLLRDCGNEGSVLVYSAGFEKACINDLAERFPDLATDLRAINHRIVDLRPVMQNNYYHPEQKGSFSLKDVLPTVAPDLDYAELEGVQEGGMAMDAYAEAIHPDTPEPRKQQLEQQLREYCKLDTLALVRLWQFWQR